MAVTLEPWADGSALNEELTVLWILVCTCFVFFMQCGFALLECGGVREKNVKNILLKNAIDAALATAAWWAIGFSFAYGDPADCSQNPFIGHGNFFSSNSNDTSSGLYWASWVFSWAFSATAATIVSGSVAERMQFKAYATYTMLISAFVYPVVVHWVWSPSGWLSARRTPCDSTEHTPVFSNTNGLMDFAGSGVVHMVGGGAALMGAIMLGPRLGRFDDDGKVVHFEQASPTNMALGVFILWLGWYGFNAGSTGCFAGCIGVSAKIVANTTLSVAFCGLGTLLLAAFLGEASDIGPMLNGILAGAVSITAGCAMVQAYAAVLIGLIGSVVYTCTLKLLLRLRIDDPLDAIPVHFACGAWGLLAVGFFATETSTKAAYGYANDWGVFYGGRGYQLGLQVLGTVVIAAWSCGITGVVFWILKKVDWLRVPKEVEVKGLDFAQSLTGKAFSHYKAAVWMAYDTIVSPGPGSKAAARIPATHELPMHRASSAGMNGVVPQSVPHSVAAPVVHDHLTEPRPRMSWRAGRMSMQSHGGAAHEGRPTAAAPGDVRNDSAHADTQSGHSS